jgi:hypothetical protein
VQDLFEPQLLGLVDDDEQHFVVLFALRILRRQHLVERQVAGIGHVGHATGLGDFCARYTGSGPSRRLVPFRLQAGSLTGTGTGSGATGTRSSPLISSVACSMDAASRCMNSARFSPAGSGGR